MILDIFETVGDFFADMFDAVADAFSAVTDWMNDNLADGPWAALLTVVIITIIGIAVL